MQIGRVIQQDNYFTLEWVDEETAEHFDDFETLEDLDFFAEDCNIKIRNLK
jgi:hypothetical protein